MQFTFREPLDAVTGVAEQNAAGAVAIHQHRHQLITGGLRVVAIAISGLQQRFNILFADQIAQPVQFVVAEFIARQQHGHRISDRAVVFLFFDKLFEIVETVRIEQAQTGEMAFHPQLFWRGGQQQHARYAFS